MSTLDLTVHAALLLVDAALLLRRRAAWGVVALPAAAVVVGLTTRATSSWIFPVATALGWAGFVHLPGLMLIAALFPPRSGLARAAPGGGPGALGRTALALGGAAILGLGGWCTLVEPRRLEVSRVPLAAPGIDRPVRVALVADLQTDHVDDHTLAALAKVEAAQPDLILFAGDYLQLRGADFDRELPALREAVARLHAPLGAFAVEGDVDPDDWARIFEGTGVQALARTTTLDLGPLTLTALAPRDSRSGAPPVPEVPGFHLVFGHAPDYTLAAPAGDLFLAGHTHGGQVRLPGVGPLLTFSAVPREAAAGLSHLPDGRPLYVSRGVGMERSDAPRVRFNCPPEVVILELGGGELAGRAPSAAGSAPSPGSAPDAARGPAGGLAAGAAP